MANGVGDRICEVAGTVPGGIYQVDRMFTRPCDCILCLFAKAFCLGAEIISGILQIISCVSRGSAELLSCSRSALQGIQQRDGCPGRYAYSKSQPVIFRTHWGSTST